MRSLPARCRPGRRRIGGHRARRGCGAATTASPPSATSVWVPTTPASVPITTPRNPATSTPHRLAATTTRKLRPMSSGKKVSVRLPAGVHHRRLRPVHRRGIAPGRDRSEQLTGLHRFVVTQGAVRSLCEPKASFAPRCGAESALHPTPAWSREPKEPLRYGRPRCPPELRRVWPGRHRVRPRHRPRPPAQASPTGPAGGPVRSRGRT